MYEIILNETQRVSDAREAPEVVDSDCDENNLYQVEKTSLEDTKQKLNYVSMSLNVNIDVWMGLKIEMIWYIYMINNEIKYLNAIYYMI